MKDGDLLAALRDELNKSEEEKIAGEGGGASRGRKMCCCAFRNGQPPIPNLFLVNEGRVGMAR